MDYYYEDRHHMLEGVMPLSIYRNQDFTYRAHWHPEVELMYVEAGSMDIAINNHRRKLVEGEFSICLSGDIHYYESNEDRSQSLMLVFKPDYFNLASNWPGAISFQSPFVSKDVIEAEHGRKIHGLLQAIMAETLDKGLQYETMVDSLIRNLCVTLLRTVPTVDNLHKVQDPSSLGLIKDVLAYIEGHYRENITLKALASTFSVDAFNLSKKFNKVTGMNLKSYVNTLRIAQAEQMIVRTDKKIIDIALSCGFDSVRTFNRAFLKITEATPSTYRSEKHRIN